MISKAPASHRFHIDHGWLKTYHLFSFGSYFDPKNIHFGSLRVFNDDVIAGQTGFGEHHHENMEIVTIVHAGELTHKDSIGNTGTITAGEVQYMSAGTGVTHAELNAGDAPVHLYQIWVLPKEENLTPTYEQKSFISTAKKNELVPLASGEEKEGALVIRTDATIYMCELEQGQTIPYAVANARGAFIYIREGSLQINKAEFEAHDQARIHGEEQLSITAQQNAWFVLIDVPMVIR